MYKYYFEGNAWIPDEKDFNNFQAEVIANSEGEAVEKLERIYRYMKGWAIVNVEQV